MNTKHIRHISNTLKNYNAQPLGIARKYAVLLPLIQHESDLHILFEVRARSLRTQPGEVSFPGGRVETDETFLQTAIRETVEELRIRKESIELLGPLDYVVTPYNLMLYPYAGLLAGVELDSIQFSTQEVEDIFTVPLSYFMTQDPQMHYVQIRTEVPDDFPFNLIPNGRNYKWRTGTYPVPFYEYYNHVIWGMTARIVRNFVRLVAGG